jgi:hypothetical protein
VQISADIQQYSGVKTLTLSNSEFYPEAKATAVVVDLVPMLELRADYQQIQSQYNLAKLSEHAAAQEKQRLQTLAKATKSVASKNLIYAESTWQEAKAKREGVEAQLNGIKDRAINLWSSEIANWLFAKDSTQWERLISNTDNLLLVTLPIERSLPEYIKQVRLARDGMPDDALNAMYVSEAHQLDIDLQGETHFFKVSDSKLRSGMRFDAWYHAQLQPLTGVFVPEEAIVWTSGEAWIYIEKEEGEYQRRSLDEAIPANKGMFLTEGSELSAGDELVVSGAQMLLLEEFRWQIMDEDDD